MIDNEEWDIVDVATHNSVSAETSAAWAVSDVWPAPPIADHSDDSKVLELCNWVAYISPILAR